jgi:hypothetical protein
VVADIDPEPTAQTYTAFQVLPEAQRVQIKEAIASLEEVRITMLAQTLEQLSGLTATLQTLRQVSSNVSYLTACVGPEEDGK